MPNIDIDESTPVAKLKIRSQFHKQSGNERSVFERKQSSISKRDEGNMESARLKYGPLLVAFVGFPGSGKSEISQILSENSSDVVWIKSREIVELLSDSNAENDLQLQGMKFMSTSNARDFLDVIISKTKAGKLNIFDSLRPVAHWNEITNFFGKNALLVSIEVCEEIRIQRLQMRDGKETAGVRMRHKVEGEIPVLIQKADIHILNEAKPIETVLNLLGKILAALNDIKNDDYTIHADTILKIESQLVGEPCR